MLVVTLKEYYLVFTILYVVHKEHHDNYQDTQRHTLDTGNSSSDKENEQVGTQLWRSANAS